MHNALLLLPDFATILLGAGLRRWMPLDEGFWTGLEKLIYYVLFPALLFNALTRTQLDFVVATPLVTAALIAVLVGMMFGLLAFKLFTFPPIALASRFQCTFRFNTYIGIAVARKLYGEDGIAAMGVIVGVLVPITNAAAIWMLARHGTFSVWRELARNPLVIATLAGLIANLTGLPIPDPAKQFLSRLSEATIATGLLAVGAALRWQVSVRSLHSEIYFLAVKLVIVPVAAWYAGRWFGLQGMYFGVLIVFASLPTASSAYILASRMGGDGAGVAWLISAGTLTAMVTMSIWINLIV